MYIGNVGTDRSVAFVVARLSSSRLPAKHLRPIGDRPMLQWVFDQLRRCAGLDEVVLATVAEAENRPLQEFAEKNGIACFWYEGAVDHVTTRLRRAAEVYNADICILVSGDCPLIHAPAIDQMICALKENPDADTVRLPADAHGRPPALQGIVVGRKMAWQLADDLADRPELKEHQFPVIGLRPERFHPVDVSLPELLYMPHHRLSVDTLADFDFMNAIYGVLDERHLPFQLPHVVALLKEHPDLKQVNAHVHQRRLVEDVKKILFVVDAGSRYGFGHLTRCMELAQQTTERLGWPTHFLIDDLVAQEIIDKTGCKTYWGAFDRSANLNSGQQTSPIETVFPAYDMIIFDIFDQRGPECGWRPKLSRAIQCVVIENSQPWTREADMIVFPNLLDKHASGSSFQKHQSGTDTTQTIRPKVVGGEPFVILRNEIRRLSAHPPGKAIDVLVYLHDRQRRKAVEEVVVGLGLSCKVMGSFESEFADNLARARVLVSGFGVSFNEAVALGTLPVCWPDSDAHRDDAESFYRHLGMAPLIIASATAIKKMISPLLKDSTRMPKPIQDGTPNIVAEIAALFRPACT